MERRFDDPTRDLDALSSLEAVVAQGRLYSREAIESTLVRHQRHFNGFLFDRISVFLARVLIGRMFDEEVSGGSDSRR